MWRIWIVSLIVLYSKLNNNLVTTYTPIGNDNVFNYILLPEILKSFDKSNDGMDNYYNLNVELPKRINIVSQPISRRFPVDYEFQDMFKLGASNPTLRDQEYLQHSSLWGHQYVSGGAGELPNHTPPLIKPDTSLPAYCNPPNPCPLGYNENQGCLIDFENTALFSREYQAAQDCTCDNEHMFECGVQENRMENNAMPLTMEKFLMHQFQNDNRLEDSNHNTVSGTIKQFFNTKRYNPFLNGEQLPIAAKKGLNILQK